MQQAVREITEMAERLETSRLKREQGDAVIQAINAKLSRITGWMVTLLVALVGTLAGVLARGMWP